MGADSYHPQESQCSRLQSGSMSILDSAVFGGQNFGYLFLEGMERNILPSYISGLFHKFIRILINQSGFHGSGQSRVFF